MCGIVGFISGERNYHSTKFLAGLTVQLLMVDQLRGMDSTGVFVVGEDNGWLEYKRGLDATTYLATKPFESMIAPALPSARLMLGHNRSATKGTINDQNAHPFSHKHIVAVHNGHIQNANQLTPAKWPILDVDSEAIPIVLAEKNSEKDALEALRGPFAIAWYNQNDGSLNLARNDERPMAFCTLKHHNIMVFASEANMLWYVLNRMALQIDEKIKITNVGVHYKFNINNPKEVPVRDTFKTKQEEYKGPYAGSRFRGGWGNPWRDNDDSYFPATGACSTSGANANTNSGQNASSNTSGTTSADSKSGQVRVLTEAERRHRIFLKRYEKLSQSTINKEGWPANTKKINKIVARLNIFGSYLGQQMLAVPDSWTPYGPKQKLGDGSMHRLGTSAFTVTLPNISEQDFKDLDKRAVATAVNVEVINVNKYGPIVRLLSLEEEYLRRERLKSANECWIHDTQHPEAPNYWSGPNGNKISTDQWLSMTSCGCGNCGTFMSFDNSYDKNGNPLIIWIGDTALCAECSTSPTVLAALGVTSEQQKVAE